MENEIWKDVPGYAGIYQVSNYGRVKSLPKSYIICNKYVVTAKEKVLKQRKVKGYKIIELNHKGIARRFPVHVLVAKMFIPNPNNYPEIDHIDTDRANNKFSNLRWCTHSMNMNNPITKEKIRNIPRIKGKENPLFEGKSPDAKAVIQYDMKNTLWLNITAYTKQQEKTILVIVVLQGYAEAKEKHIKNLNGVMKQKVIILDGGHGVDCAGKRSPIWGDGSQLLEWEFNRDIVRRIAAMLKAEGIKFEILVPEDNDVSLPERCRRANVIHADCGNNAVLFSVHGNAGGGTGWECYTSVGQTKADAIATVLCNEAEKEFAPDGWKMRFDHTDGDPDKENQFYILKHTVCPAVLSENFFMDTEKDCRFMLSDAGRERIAKIHYEAIKRIL